MRKKKKKKKGRGKKRINFCPQSPQRPNEIEIEERDTKFPKSMATEYRYGSFKIYLCSSLSPFALLITLRHPRAVNASR